MFEEILHLGGSPLDTELLGIFVSFTFQTSCAVLLEYRGGRSLALL